MKLEAFSFTRTGGGKLCEYYDGQKWYFEYSDNNNTRAIDIYDIKENSKSYNRLYLGYTVEEVLDSGKDILAEKLLENGEISYREVKGILNPVTKNAFCFLGGTASHAGLTVDTMGLVYPQLSGRDREPSPQFSPRRVDDVLGSLKPRQCMLGQEYPILCSVHSDGIRSLEFLYFVEPGDSDRDPVLWIRAKWYTNENPQDFKIKHFVSFFSMDDAEEISSLRDIQEAQFNISLSDTVAYWIKFSEKSSIVTLPERELETVSRGALAFTAITFTADKPHYGHKYYGKEFHDNFPPNYIWSIEAAILMGHTDWAKRIFDYMINYAINDEGRINYRMGNLIYGSSAAEYGMLLELTNHFREKLGVSALSDEAEAKLRGMGNIILSNCRICPEFKDRLLVKMCAEADNNVRVNVYLNNNLWAIRGLFALSELLKYRNAENTDIYSDTAILLQKNINEMLTEHYCQNTRFGDLVPFRFGYSAEPYTLSNCKDTIRPLSEKEHFDYFEKKKNRQTDTEDGVQDLTENTYANYRYYPEILSSMLLPEKYSEAIVKMRESIGGELLGMTRFRSWIDNWPVLSYARYLMESGKTEKYLLLLYAHTAHHGHPELICYYEQVKLSSEANMPDCVPSLLTTPIMTAWMFAFEKSDNSLLLLGALPTEWYKKPFEVKNIGYSNGYISIKSDGKAIDINFDSPCKCETKLVWRCKKKVTDSDISFGKEYIKEISGNTITLKSGFRKARLIIE